MTREFLLGVAERAVASYAYAALTFLIADGADLTDLSFLKAAALAGLPAALSVLKSAASRFIGDSESGVLFE